MPYSDYSKCKYLNYETLMLVGDFVSSLCIAWWEMFSVLEYTLYFKEEFYNRFIPVFLRQDTIAH